MLFADPAGRDDAPGRARRNRPERQPRRNTGTRRI
jgi:hypothetical protein